MRIGDQRDDMNVLPSLSLRRAGLLYSLIHLFIKKDWCEMPVEAARASPAKARSAHYAALTTWPNLDKASWGERLRYAIVGGTMVRSCASTPQA